MANWYIKEFGKLTGVSVRTLHHYDQIGLLKPSVRQTNGYRLYSEEDLLKQQQIVALKSFGFELAQIQKLLYGDVDIMLHLKKQLRFLEAEINNLSHASRVLKQVITECFNNQSQKWEIIISSSKMCSKIEQQNNSSRVTKYSNLSDTH
ncbi:MAG: MerR family transcriptional regulator [Rickettsiaceae bacterium]|nr:MerR family transcriptional regulator [Rickettsiaceae bacterium]MDP4832120.1 MerR family transcriptional regulator [Rickettsiaceae bacterium]MDP5020316.1 MerR family transcriptional regulator [Rickettsiaceae bacterium]MDP5082636.1 MerR family transcriptional regulator [Rickettsiaceae bacterium]